MRGLEAMESELLYKMKILNGALHKELKTPAEDHYMEAGGFRYNTKLVVTQVKQ